MTFRATVLRLLQGTGFTVILSQAIFEFTFMVFVWQLTLGEGTSFWLPEVHTLHNFSVKL